MSTTDTNPQTGVQALDDADLDQAVGGTSDGATRSDNSTRAPVDASVRGGNATVLPGDGSVKGGDGSVRG